MPILVAIWEGIVWFASLFASGGAIYVFFQTFFKKIFSIVFALGVQRVFVVSLLVFKLSFLFLVFELVLWTYNQIHYILENIDIYFNGNELAILAFNFFKSIGILEAFKTTFEMFSHVLVTVFILVSMKIALKVMKSFSDEIFKLGVLLGL